MICSENKNQKKMLIIKLTHAEFVNYLSKILPQNSDTIMYGYLKKGLYSTTYFYTEDIIQDKEKHGIIFEKIPRIDAQLPYVIDNINEYVFKENGNKTRVIDIEQISHDWNSLILSGTIIVSLKINK